MVSVRAWFQSADRFGVFTGMRTWMRRYAVSFGAWVGTLSSILARRLAATLGCAPCVLG